VKAARRDLAPQEALVLDHLRTVVGVGTSISKGALAVGLGLAPGSITKALNGLRRRGLVESRRSVHKALDNGRPVWAALGG
jgi:DNA-binding MarR family transcriptional regulator